MPDTRRHRGPHPHDADLFSPGQVPALRTAVAELSWLLSRGYASVSSLKLVGDRHRLTERQRTAVQRCAAAEDAVTRRHASRVPMSALRGEAVAIDGFNLLTTIEAALAHGVVIIGRDGCPRDMASMHGSWRKVTETRPAAEMIGQALHDAGAAGCRWLLDSPVSNSGRLAQLLRVLASSRGWNWTVETVPSPDAELKASDDVVLTADSVILDHCRRWCDLTTPLLAQTPDAWIVQLA